MARPKVWYIVSVIYKDHRSRKPVNRWFTRVRGAKSFTEAARACIIHLTQSWMLTHSYELRLRQTKHQYIPKGKPYQILRIDITNELYWRTRTA